MYYLPNLSSLVISYYTIETLRLKLHCILNDNLSTNMPSQIKFVVEPNALHLSIPEAERLHSF